MELDLFVVKDGENLRCGYTTGSCATAAAKACAIMLETGEEIDYVQIDTPAGIDLRLKVNDINLESKKVSCSIIKDAGDDPDNTDGIKIFAQVEKNSRKEIIIEGGIGIGRIGKKGLFGKVGEAAINPVPRQMIKKELSKISDSGYNVLIYAPEGEAIGRKTFNSNIGIEGGISIIGTKGIVYPMSEKALLDTIYLEIDMIRENFGLDNIILVPGNYGENIAKEIGKTNPSVKISNYIGEALTYAYKKGFKSITLVGHIGKFAKLAIGIFNTHSKVSDARMEAFIYYLAHMEAPIELINMIDATLTAEEALIICVVIGYGEIVSLMEKGSAERIRTYIKDREMEIEVIIYSMERGVNLC